MFKSAIFTCAFTLISLNISSQIKPIYVYDIATQTLDSLPIISYDSTITSALTAFSLGNFDSNVEQLSEELPSDGVYPNSQFTYKKRAEDVYNLQNFPIRTSVKIQSILNGEVGINCSGSLISKRHVLTAGHCVFYANPIDLNITDSLFISPVFNNGENNVNFPLSQVVKIYFTEDWTDQGDDFAVLELAEPIGNETGWIGVGFEEDVTELFDGIFYKFTYPSATISAIDTNEYNGDTLYYNYGAITTESNYSLGVSGASGVTGESGSSIVKVSNGEVYTSYGVMTFSSGLQHQRFTKKTYHQIEDIIQDDLVVEVAEIETIGGRVWPNPVVDQLNIDGIGFNEVIGFSVFDSSGKAISTGINGTGSQVIIDTSRMPAGLYFFRLETGLGSMNSKFIKLAQ